MTTRASGVDFGSRQWVLRTGAVALRWRLRAVVCSIVLAALAMTLGAYALTLGDLHLTAHQVGSALSGSASPFVHLVVVEWRLPRVLAALAFGAALGVAGAIFQSLTRNPLASPDVIGLTSGAYTGGLAAIVAGGAGFWTTASGSLVGGGLTAIAVYVLAWRGGVLGFRLIVVGIGVSAMLTALNTYLLMRVRVEVAMAASAWGAGSLNEMTWQVLAPALALLAATAVVLVPFGRTLGQLELGDDAALATGVRVERARVALIGVGVALTAAATAACGPIAFVSLVAPQIARRIARAQGVPLVASALTGSVLLIASDLIAQHTLAVDLPVGLVTIVIGGLYLAWALVREDRRPR